jgi:16S rRNA processing protein RimM
MPESRILMGVIGRPHGVRGLVHVASYTADPAGIAAYGPLLGADGRRYALSMRGADTAEIADVTEGAPRPVSDRTAAERLTNLRLYIEREKLPAPAEEEFYLADLIGLAAVDAAGAELGRVAAVHDYGAGASLEISRAEATPLLVPFTRAAVPVVDIAGGRVSVVPPEEIVGEQAA